MALSPFSNEPVLLWGTPDTVHCSLKRCDQGPPYEITVYSGSELIRRRTFEWHVDAADFAIAQMRALTADPTSTPAAGSSREASAEPDSSDS